MMEPNALPETEALPSWDETEPVTSTLPSWDETEPVVENDPSDIKEVNDDTNKNVMYNEGYADTLPDKLNFGLFEVDTPEGLEALVSGFKHGASDTTRGVQQILELNEDSLALEEAEMNMLYNSDKGGWARTGQVLGLIADPVGFIAPWLAVNKVRKAYKFLDTVNDVNKATRTTKIATTAGEGAIAGAISGATSYIDEESGMNRWTSTGIGAFFGGSVGGLAGKYVDWKGAKEAEASLNSFNKDVASIMVEQDKTYTQAVKEVFDLYPELQNKIKQSSSYIDTTPTRFNSKGEAQIFIDQNVNYKQHWRTGKPYFDKAFGLLSTRLGNYSQTASQKLKMIDFNSQSWAHEWKQGVKPFEDVFNTIMKKDPASAEKITYGLYTQDFRIVNDELEKSGIPDAIKHFSDAQVTLNKIFDKGTELGMFKPNSKIQDYWHREVEDYDGLIAHLMDKEKDKVKTKFNKTVEELVDDFVSGYQKDHKSPPSEHQINQYKLALLTTKSKKPPTINLGYGKNRNITVTPDMMKFYKKPLNAIDSYIHNAAIDMAKAEFLGGKNGVKISQYGDLDVGESIGNFMKLSDDFKDLKPNQRQEVASIIEARMMADKMNLPSKLAAYRSLTHAYLLGNPFSALTQLGDLYAPIYKNRLGSLVEDAFKENVRKKGGSPDFSVQDFGFVDTAIAEMESTGSVRKFTNNILTAGGFNKMDHFGKKVFMNNAYSQLEKAAMDGTSKEARYFSNKYRRLFGDDYNTVIREIRNMEDGGKLSEKAKAILYMELSDFQPIGLSETTELYARSQSFKAAYFLQSFTLKMFDVQRREAFRLMRLGAANKDSSMIAEGAKNMTKLALLVSSTNMGVNALKDWIRGRDTEMEPEEVPLAFVRNLFRTYGLDPFVLEREILVKKDPGGAVKELITSGPGGLFAPIKDATKAAAGTTEKDAWGVEHWKADPDAIARFAPVVGPVMTNMQWARDTLTDWGIMPEVEETPTEKYNKRREDERAQIRRENFMPDVSSYAEGGAVSDVQDPRAASRIQSYQDSVDAQRQVVGQQTGEGAPTLPAPTQSPVTGQSKPITQEMRDASTPLTRAGDAIQSVGKETSGNASEEGYIPVVSEMRHILKPSAESIGEGVARSQKLFTEDNSDLNQDDIRTIGWAALEGTDLLPQKAAATGAIGAMTKGADDIVKRFRKTAKGTDTFKGDVCHGESCKALGKRQKPTDQVLIFNEGKHSIVVDDKGKIVSDNPMGTYDPETETFTSDGSMGMKGAQWKLDKKVSAKELDSPFELDASKHDVPVVSQVFKNPEYYIDKKNVKASIVEMTPEEYFSKVDEIFKEGDPEYKLGEWKIGVDQERVDRYVKDMKNGDKFPMPFLDYRSPDFPSQEGRHRILAASKLGQDTIPVAVIERADPSMPYRYAEGGAVEVDRDAQRERFESMMREKEGTNMVKRMLDPKSPSLKTEYGEETHRMSAEVLEDGRWVVFPTIVDKGDGKLQKLVKDDKDRAGREAALRHAMQTGEYFDFGDDKEAALTFSGAPYDRKTGATNSYKDTALWGRGKGLTKGKTTGERANQAKKMQYKAEGGEIKDNPVKKLEAGLYKDDAGQYWKVSDNGDMKLYDFS